MEFYTLENTPNQKFSILIEGEVYYFQIREGKGSMLISVDRGDTPLIQGKRLIINAPVLEYPHLQNALGGDFYLYSLTDELANWKKFGVTQFFLYSTESELA